MRSVFASLTLNGRLALLALILGAVAVLAQPTRGSVVRLDTRELAGIVGREVDHVSAQDLAEWIVAGRSDYRLIDLRDEKAFGAYHIPTAENVPMPTLADHPLGRNEKIVLYSDGGIHSAQGWFLLKAAGYKGVYILRGGLDEWKDGVLFPHLPDHASQAERAAFEKAAAVSRRFGGSPQIGGAPMAEAVAMPMPTVEQPSALPGAKPTRKKKKEGC